MPRVWINMLSGYWLEGWGLEGGGVKYLVEGSGLLGHDLPEFFRENKIMMDSYGQRLDAGNTGDFVHLFAWKAADGLQTPPGIGRRQVGVGLVRIVVHEGFGVFVHAEVVSARLHKSGHDLFGGKQEAAVRLVEFGRMHKRIFRRGERLRINEYLFELFKQKLRPVKSERNGLRGQGQCHVGRQHVVGPGHGRPVGAAVKQPDPFAEPFLFRGVEPFVKTAKTLQRGGQSRRQILRAPGVPPPVDLRAQDKNQGSGHHERNDPNRVVAILPGQVQHQNGAAHKRRSEISGKYLTHNKFGV